MHGVYDCARFVPCSPLTHGVTLPSHLQNGIGTSDFGHFHSSIPSLRSPLRTLHACPHGQPRITRGRDGWLNPISWGTCTSLSFASLPGALRQVAGHSVDVGGIAGFRRALRPASGARLPAAVAAGVSRRGLDGGHRAWRGHGSGVACGGAARAACDRRLRGGAQPAGVGGHGGGFRGGVDGRAIPVSLPRCTRGFVA